MLSCTVRFAGPVAGKEDMRAKRLVSSSKCRTAESLAVRIIEAAFLLARLFVSKVTPEELELQSLGKSRERKPPYILFPSMDKNKTSVCQQGLTAESVR